MNPPDTSAPKLLYQADSFYNGLYGRGLEITGTPEAKRRRERFYNLVQFFLLSAELEEGLTAECGCWRGLSSFILCNYIKKETPSFDGSGYHIFDSFKGLSQPTSVDALSDTLVTELNEKFGGLDGAFAASVPDVKAALAEFPNIEYHEGWIPAVFDGLPEGRYRFVHIDLDLYEPTRASIEYFYPRLVNGGLIVCDDYGSLLWPGAKQAVDSYCIESGVPFIRVSTGQAVIWKRGPVDKIRPSQGVASLRRSLAEAKRELNRSQADLLGAGEKARIAEATKTKELKVRLGQLSTRFAEVKAKARAKQEEFVAHLAEMRKERDDTKAELRRTASRLAEAEARTAHLGEIREKLLQVRAERDKAKARAVHFAKRLAETKEQLRQQNTDSAPSQGSGDRSS